MSTLSLPLVLFCKLGPAFQIQRPGLETAYWRSRARSADRGGQIPAVALTAYARDEERLKALSSGFQMHVSKPISNRELISAITTLAR
jgi:CheY-like chemotaxis protein